MSYSVMAAILVVLVLLIAWAVWRHEANEGFHRGRRHCRGGQCSGPHNIGLYDYPYKYPSYEGRSAIRWDGDRRCVAYCGQSPCTIWCR